MEKKLQKISYILQFIDSARFVTSSLSDLAINVSEGVHRIKCKCEPGDTHLKLVELNVKLL